MQAVVLVQANALRKLSLKVLLTLLTPICASTVVHVPMFAPVKQFTRNKRLKNEKRRLFFKGRFFLSCRDAVARLYKINYNASLQINYGTFLQKNHKIIHFSGKIRTFALLLR